MKTALWSDAHKRLIFMGDKATGRLASLYAAVCAYCVVCVPVDKLIVSNYIIAHSQFAYSIAMSLYNTYCMTFEGSVLR